MSVKVLNNEDQLRAEILEDGTVKDANGKIVGYINEDGSSGDAYVAFFILLKYSLICFSNTISVSQSSKFSTKKLMFCVLCSGIVFLFAVVVLF
jgi:hypothetical protein